ncbi:hypothetical protein [Umezawaea sp. Da 62-37]|uniref:hypothetical protein n=1 Tax=Umezawaea sp. Da 62-37 TaxID=3075927 RepID=UPI0028F73958|nr:hypothetical protein [Umezawaea sp. Da 62-37]WNV90024.1 hypothetical protein RM788_17520 [Umezawaea sp. Da 62-37]
MTTNDRLLRFALGLDGLASAGLGVLTLPFGTALGLPLPVALGIGAFLIAYGAGVFFVGTRPAVNRTIVRVVVLGNVLWVVDSVLAIELDWFPLTALGVVLVVLQAVAVAGFAALQVVGLNAAARTGVRA